MSTQALDRQEMACPLCGTRFNPALHQACERCPLHQGCALTCCPGCGYSTIVESQSRLSRWLTELFKKEHDDERMAKG